MLDAGDGVSDRAEELAEALVGEQEATSRAMNQIDILNQQISALRRQIAALESALEASEARDRESQARIADLGSRLNVALAQRVQELARFRSDFFGRLRQILGDRDDIPHRRRPLRLPVGSPLPPPPRLSRVARGTATRARPRRRRDSRTRPGNPARYRLGAARRWPYGRPPDRDGAGFPSNWYLSSARAIEVVEYLIEAGVPPENLLAAGFGEFQPIDTGDTDEAYARNRRIEFKLTER